MKEDRKTLIGWIVAIAYFVIYLWQTYLQDKDLSQIEHALKIVPH